MRGLLLTMKRVFKYSLDIVYNVCGNADEGELIKDFINMNVQSCIGYLKNSIFS